jgi:hypothetical protein
VNGALVLVPKGATFESLRTDCAKMIEDGLFLDTPETFESVVDCCRDIQKRANALASS